MKLTVNIIVLLIQTFLGLLIWRGDLEPKTIGLYWFIGGIVSIIMFVGAWAYAPREEED